MLTFLWRISIYERDIHIAYFNGKLFQFICTIILKNKNWIIVPSISDNSCMKADCRLFKRLCSTGWEPHFFTRARSQILDAWRTWGFELPTYWFSTVFRYHSTSSSALLIDAWNLKSHISICSSASNFLSHFDMILKLYMYSVYVCVYRNKIVFKLCSLTFNKKFLTKEEKKMFFFHSSNFYQIFSIKSIHTAEVHTQGQWPINIAHLVQKEHKWAINEVIPIHFEDEI